jgi:hypothetical protein
MRENVIAPHEEGRRISSPYQRTWTKAYIASLEALAIGSRENPARLDKVQQNSTRSPGIPAGLGAGSL